MKLVLLLTIVIPCISSSAIPIWELLNHQEKTSFIYSIFANQVNSFCKDSSCQKELKRHGLKTLKNLPSEALDNIDPYQKGSHALIWKIILKGHPLLKPSTVKPTTTKPNYDDFSLDLDVGSEPSASTKINQIEEIAPTKISLSESDLYIPEPKSFIIKLNGIPFVVHLNLPDEDLIQYQLTQLRMPYF